MKRYFTVTLGLPTAVSTILLSYMMAVPMEGTHAKSVAPKCVLVTVNSTWKWPSDGLELVFGNITQDFKRAQRLCKLHNATLPYEGMVDSIKPCLGLGNTSHNGYYWIQTCPDVSTSRVFNANNTMNVGVEMYHNYVCVIAKETHLVIEAEGQRNKTYINTGTKNTFQAWTGQKLNLVCESGLQNMLSRLCIKNGVNNEACETSNNMTWTPDNCENNITVTCESLHCPGDIPPAGKANVSINVQCPLQIVSFTSNSRHDTGGAGVHIYNMGDDITFQCVTKGSTDVTILKTQGMKMEETGFSRNHTYSVTGFGCDDMGAYYCIAKQGDSQVNRSVNVTVRGSCPPKLCSEQTQGEGSLDNETVGHPVSVCIMASGLSNLVKFNGQLVHCGSEMSSPPWQCSIKRTDQIFMTYNFTFIIQDDSLLVDKKVTIGLETEKPGGELNLTYTLDTDGRRLYLITTPQASPNDTSEGLSLSLAVIISIILIVIVLIVAGFILGVLYRKMKGKHQSYSYHMPLSLMSTTGNHNGHVNRGSENTDELELHSSVHVGLHLSCPTPTHERQDSQQSEESRDTLLRPVEGEPNASLYQNLSEAKCTSTMGVYANLSDFRDTSGPSQRLASQPATNSALKAKGQNGYHPMTPVSSSPTAGSYVSQEGLVYITVDHSLSSGNTRSALDRQRGFNERDSIQYAKLDFTNTGKYDIRRDKMKLKRLKHERHN